MSLAIVEQIAVKIKARIEAVTVANGYTTTVSQCVRPPRLSFSAAGMTSYSVAMVQDTPTRMSEMDFAGNPNGIAWAHPFDITLIIRPSESSTTPIDTLINAFVSDVVKGIATPASGDWSQWDGLALLSEFGDPSYVGDEDDNSFIGVSFPLVVIYRIAENDPYTQR